jgi:hypothetical protein
MFALTKKALAVAFGLVVMAGQAAQATTIYVGDLPTDGSSLLFSGNLAPSPDDIHDDIYNFYLPFDVKTPRPHGPNYFHVETGNAGFITDIYLYDNNSTYDERGAFWIANNMLSYYTFGDGCLYGRTFCASIGAGADPHQRYLPHDPRQNLTLGAGYYSLVVRRCSYCGEFGTFGITGEYQLQFTSAAPGGAPSVAPEPGTIALLALGLLGAGFARKRRAH